MGTRLGSLVVLMALFACGVAVAQGVHLGLEPQNPLITPGAAFDLELRVTETGSPFNAFDAVIAYDPGTLTFVPLSPASLQEGAYMKEACGATFHRFSAAGDSLTITDVLLCNQVFLTGPGQLYKLRFIASSTPQPTTVEIRSAGVYAGGIQVTPVFTSDAVIGIGGNTFPGSNVSVIPSDTGLGLGQTTLTFSDITSAGTTTVSSSSTGAPPPDGFKVGQPPAYFEIGTTAIFSGPVEVCFDYSGLSFANESLLRVFHRSIVRGPWVDVTSSLDTENDVICATVTSLSPFALMEREAVAGVGDEAPQEFALHLPTPNPFTGHTAIGFTLPRASAVRLEVFDLAGRLVRTLVDGDYAAGRHALEWNGTGDGGRRLGPGVYLYRLRAGAFTATRRVVLMP